MDASEAPARNLHHACGPSSTEKGLSELITIDVKLEDRRQSDVDTGKGIDCIEVEQASGLVKALSALAREQLANAGKRFGMRHAFRQRTIVFQRRKPQWRFDSHVGNEPDIAGRGSGEDTVAARLHDP